MNTRILATVSLGAGLILCGAFVLIHDQSSVSPKATPALIPNLVPGALPNAAQFGYPMERTGPLSKQSPLGEPHPDEVARQIFTPRDPWVEVDWSLKLDPKTEALYKRMATVVSGYKAIPKDRLNYYAAVNNPPDYLIHGWGGMLNNVQPLPNGGYLLTVSVEADLSVTAWRIPMMYSSDYSEQFSVDVNNKLEYVGFLDPNGWAGKMPEGWGHP